MAYDEDRQRTVLFGGLNGSTCCMNDTWEWDGSNWMEIAAPSAPSARYATAMSYDSHNHFFVLFGGDNGVAPGSLPDTWVYPTGSAATWTQANVTGLGGRRSYAVAYDRGRQATVIFGGWAGGSSYLTDTWEWNGTDPAWSQRATVGPPGSFLSAMAYDEARGQIVLFGGATAAFTTCATANAETWIWDGSAATWTQVHPAHSPTARSDHSMVYDAQRQRVVLFGGCNAAGVSNETWEWDGSDWTLMAIADPPARADFGMAFDRSRSETVAFGGCGAPPESCPTANYLDDTWTYWR